MLEMVSMAKDVLKAAISKTEGELMVVFGGVAENTRAFGAGHLRRPISPFDGMTFGLLLGFLWVNGPPRRPGFGKIPGIDPPKLTRLYAPKGDGIFRRSHLEYSGISHGQVESSTSWDWKLNE